MIVKIEDIEYTTETVDLPKSFEFEISEEIASDDQLLANEVNRLIKEKTNQDISGCSVYVD